MRHLIIAGFILLGTLGAQAEVEQFNVFLSSTNYSSTPDSYTIPAGKIYIIEGVLLAISGAAPSDAAIRVVVKADNLTFSSNLDIQISDTFDGSGYYFMPKPVRLRAGESLRVPINATYIACRYFGLMIDETELYAQEIPVELQSVEAVGGQLLAKAKFASSRPRRLTIESSMDLIEFTANATGVEVAGLTRLESDVAVDQASDRMKFMRVRATARN